MGNEEQVKLLTRIMRVKESMDEFKKFCCKYEDQKIYTFVSFYHKIKEESESYLNELRLELCKLRGE